MFKTRSRLLIGIMLLSYVCINGAERKESLQISNDVSTGKLCVTSVTGKSMTIGRAGEWVIITNVKTGQRTVFHRGSGKFLENK